jgi:hypothetical protein
MKRCDAGKGGEKHCRMPAKYAMYSTQVGEHAVFCEKHTRTAESRGWEHCHATSHKTNEELKETIREAEEELDRRGAEKRKTSNEAFNRLLDLMPTNWDDRPAIERCADCKKTLALYTVVGQAGPYSRTARGDIIRIVERRKTMSLSVPDSMGHRHIQYVRCNDCHEKLISIILNALEDTREQNN